MRKLDSVFFESLINIDNSSIDVFTYTISEFLSSMDRKSFDRYKRSFESDILKIETDDKNSINRDHQNFLLLFTQDSPFISSYPFLKKDDSDAILKVPRFIDKDTSDLIYDLGSVYRFTLRALKFAAKMKSVTDNPFYLTMLTSDILVDIILHAFFGYVGRRIVSKVEGKPLLSSFCFKSWLDDISNSKERYQTVASIGFLNDPKTVDILVKDGVYYEDMRAVNK